MPLSRTFLSDDPPACYLETFTLGDAPAIDRNDQFSAAALFAGPAARHDYADLVASIAGTVTKRLADAGLIGMDASRPA